MTNHNPFYIIGQSIRKIDALTKVNGQAIYAGDMVLPRMLHCKLLRSRHPHACIRSIDTSAALAQPGVVAVITGQDLPQKYGLLGVSKDETALAVDKVRFVGDPVAAIAAIDEETAEAALQKIVVVYEVLEAIMDVDAASQPPNDEALHADSERHNLQKLVALEFGDLDAGFANCAKIIIARLKELCRRGAWVWLRRAIWWWQRQRAALRYQRHYGA